MGQFESEEPEKEIVKIRATKPVPPFEIEPGNVVNLSVGEEYQVPRKLADILVRRGVVEILGPKTIELQTAIEPSGEPEEILAEPLREPSRASDDQAQVEDLAARDLEQIIKEMQGEPSDEYFYEIDIKDKAGKIVSKKKKLSYTGIKAIVQKMGDIHMDEPRVANEPDHFYVRVKVIDVSKNLVMWGVARQSFKMKLKTGAVVPDEFAFEKGVGRATRNAFNMVVPETVKIQFLKEPGSVKRGSR